MFTVIPGHAQAWTRNLEIPRCEVWSFGPSRNDGEWRNPGWSDQMQRRYITTDVFTDRAFGGNPLAVVLDAGGLSTAQMQSIATEFNYSATTFVLPPQDSTHDAQVRIFTVN